MDFFQPMATRFTIDQPGVVPTLDWTDIANAIARGNTLQGWRVHKWFMPCIPPAQPVYAPGGGTPTGGSYLPPPTTGTGSHNRGQGQRHTRDTDRHPRRTNPNHADIFRNFVRDTNGQVKVRQLIRLAQKEPQDLHGPTMFAPNDCKRYTIMGKCTCNPTSTLQHRNLPQANIDAIVAALDSGMQRARETARIQRQLNQNS